MTRYLIFLLLLPCFVAAQDTAFLVNPYVQYVTQNSIRVHWETNNKGNGYVIYGKAALNSGKALLTSRSNSSANANIHQVELAELESEANYFYQVIAVFGSGDTIRSSINTFQTAVNDSSAFAFAVFSDSQNDWKDPQAWKRVSEQAYKERPNFALHAGDLVDLGYMKDDWVNEFLGQGNLFMKTIPIFSIPGNHEHDAALYYQYMHVPKPYFYSFRYGNAEFFMVDTDQYQEEGTDMFNALEMALAKSNAYWKFVVHHHPPFSSDDDDFGNTYFEASTLGDDEVKQLVPLYEKYGVDIVFYGHIHTYERTWPILQNKPVTENGVLYVNVGGAGGSLENPAPTRSWFTQKLRTVHHFGYVTINQNELHFQAIDENGDLFDQFSLNKSRKQFIVNITPAAPVAHTSQRIFTDRLEIQLLSASPDEVIYYTTDGTEPGSAGPRYTTPILLEKTTEVKAIAVNKAGKSRTNTFRFAKERTYKKVIGKKFLKGLQYGYFPGEYDDDNNTYFSKTKFTHTGTVSELDLNQISHQEQYWTAVFSGFFYAPKTGYYRFDGHAEHRLRLHVHDKLLFDEKNREINYAGEIYLEAGYHPVKVEYYNKRKGRVFLELYYAGPGMERQPVPASAWWR